MKRLRCSTFVLLVTIGISACARIERIPTFRYVDSRGCTGAGFTSVRLFGWNQDRTEQVAVLFDWERLGLADVPRSGSLPIFRVKDVRTFALHPEENSIEIHVDVYERSPALAGYCTDVVSSDVPEPVVWRVVSGTAAIALNDIAPGAEASRHMYHATVRLRDLVLVSPSGRTTRPTPEVVLAGWGGVFP
jgi:hypothetical protein